jgi:hypothetical protein
LGAAKRLAATAKAGTKRAAKSAGEAGSAALKRVSSISEQAQFILHETGWMGTTSGLDKLLKEIARCDDVEMKKLELKAFKAVLGTGEPAAATSPPLNDDETVETIHADLLTELREKAIETLDKLKAATLLARDKYKSDQQRWRLMKQAITKKVTLELENQPFTSLRVREECVSLKKRAVSKSSDWRKTQLDLHPDVGVEVVSLKFVFRGPCEQR